MCFVLTNSLWLIRCHKIRKGSIQPILHRVQLPSSFHHHCGHHSKDGYENFFYIECLIRLPMSLYGIQLLVSWSHDENAWSQEFVLRPSSYRSFKKAFNHPEKTIVLNYESNCLLINASNTKICDLLIL